MTARLIARRTSLAREVARGAGRSMLGSSRRARARARARFSPGAVGRASRCAALEQPLPITPNTATARGNRRSVRT